MTSSAAVWAEGCSVKMSLILGCTVAKIPIPHPGFRLMAQKRHQPLLASNNGKEVQGWISAAVRWWEDQQLSWPLQLPVFVSRLLSPKLPQKVWECIVLSFTTPDKCVNG